MSELLLARIAEALEAEEARPQREADPRAIVETQSWTRYAAALLPVVRELQAEALEGAADSLNAIWAANGVRAMLRDRAAALRGTAS